MKKKIVIIGANSYIARNLIYTINESHEEYELSLYDCQDTHVDGYKNYKSINILSKQSVKYINFDCDVIYMFAGKTGSENGFDEYDSFIDVNERGLLNVLNEYINQNSKAKIVFPSTRLVYKGKKGKIKEDSEKEFKTVYAINKYACEKYLEMFNRVYDVQYCIFRICVPYGTLISNAYSYGTVEFMLNKASKGQNITIYGDGTVRRTLTYIGDLCNILIVSALSDKCVNDIFNVGGEDYSLLEMSEMIANKYGVKVKLVPWPEVAEKIESGDTVFDSEKLNTYYDDYEMSFSMWVSQ